MAKTKEKPDDEVQQAPEEAPAQSPEQTPEPPKTQKPAPPKEGSLLLTILTVLLVLLGIGEIALLGYVGFQAFRGSLARERYETLQAGTTQDSPQQTAGAHYLGPGLQVENGVVVWRREDSPLGGIGSGTSQTTGGGEGETRLANMTVPRIGYRLADEDEQ